MLNRLRLPIFVAQINLEGPSKQLEQHLKARLGDGGIVTPLGQLIPNEGMLRPGELVKRKHHTGVAEFLPYQITARVVDMGVFDAKDEADFAFELGEAVDGVDRVRGGGVRGGVGCGVGAEGAGVDVCGEVGYCC